MPSATQDNASANGNIIGGNELAKPRLTAPLTYSGSLDGFASNDLTPVIGREFEGLQVAELLKGDDQLIRDLAVTSEMRSCLADTHISLTKQSHKGVLSSCATKM